MPRRESMSRRERQIMDVLYAAGGATVQEVCSQLPDASTEMSIRRLLHILVEKGHVKQIRRGRANVYRPIESRRKAGAKALQNVLDTFFAGGLEEALSVHLGKKVKLDDDELQRIADLIEETRKEGR